MSKFDDGGPAFPFGQVSEQTGMPINGYHNDGMTLRQYAAIKLRVPNSGTDWLDEMIRTSLRDDLSAKAMQAMVSAEFAGSFRPGGWAKDAYEMADAVLAARGEEK